MTAGARKSNYIMAIIKVTVTVKWICMWKDLNSIPHCSSYKDYVISEAALEILINALQTAALFGNGTFEITVSVITVRQNGLTRLLSLHSDLFVQGLSGSYWDSWATLWSFLHCLRIQKETKRKQTQPTQNIQNSICTLSWYGQEKNVMR